MPDSASAPDLDLRLVRYFTVVAEHRHFGRAADALHITQPSLSRQVRRLEDLLGVRLLDRVPQGAVPTAAGEVFLPRAKALLRAAEQAAVRTRASAGSGRVTVGYATNIVVAPAVRELRRRHPAADVRTLHVAWDQAREALLTRQADAVVARLPMRTEGLRVTVLREEPRLLLMPRGHRLAGKGSVTLDDIADEPLPRLADPRWNAFWRVDPRPDGRPAPDGPLVEALEDKLELIAGGQAVAMVSAGLRADSLRPDLTTVPLEGVAPVQVVLATRAGDRDRLVAAFRACAPAHLTNR